MKEHSQCWDMSNDLEGAPPYLVGEGSLLVDAVVLVLLLLHVE